MQIIRPTFFVMSLGDFGDAAVDDEWRAEALVEMLNCVGLDFMILTKRPEALRELWERASLKMTPSKRAKILAWLDGSDVPSNIAIGATVENAKVAQGRLKALADFPASRRFVSAEPLLAGGWSSWLHTFPVGTFHLLIAGGESLHQARPMHPVWALELEKACDQMGIPYHFKQWGEWVPADVVAPDWTKPITGNFLVIDLFSKTEAYNPKKPPHFPEVLVWRAGKKGSGYSCDETGRTRTERLVFPGMMRKETWFRADFPIAERFFPGLVAAEEWKAANPEAAHLVKPTASFRH